MAVGAPHGVAEEGDVLGAVSCGAEPITAALDAVALDPSVTGHAGTGDTPITALSAASSRAARDIVPDAGDGATAPAAAGSGDGLGCGARDAVAGVATVITAATTAAAATVAASIVVAAPAASLFSGSSAVAAYTTMAALRGAGEQGVRLPAMVSGYARAAMDVCWHLRTCASHLSSARCGAAASAVATAVAVPDGAAFDVAATSCAVVTAAWVAIAASFVDDG
jgi:hypothetical protein